MASITFTRKHMLEALAIKGHVHRKWTDQLPPYAFEDTKERYSRKYNSRDLLFFLIVQFLIIKYGMSIEVIAGFSGGLSELLEKPLSMSSSGQLLINIETGEVKLAQGVLPNQPSILVPMDEPLRKYRVYLGSDIDTPQQSALPFAFEMLSNRKSS